MTVDYKRPLRDLASGHPVLQQRWIMLSSRLSVLGFPMFVNEVYRPDLRQQWLWAQGRTADECRARGVPPEFARPGAIVTNAWSAKTSAHGWTETRKGVTVPAAAALDVVPVGKDGKPWTADDDWDGFLRAMTAEGYAIGLVHFHKPGEPPSDKPHLQLKEWSDASHQLLL